MVLVVDRDQALVGQSLDQEPTGVWTNHRGLATVVRKYVLEHFFEE